MRIFTYNNTIYNTTGPVYFWSSDHVRLMCFRCHHVLHSYSLDPSSAIAKLAAQL